MTSKEGYNPKNPDAFKQVELPDEKEPELNIVPLSKNQSTIKEGDFASKNFKHLKAGWRLSEDGTLECQGAIIGGYTVTNIGTFGGDGSNGDLSIDSGTTTIDLGGAAVYTLNYLSMHITGTASLAFSNPHPSGTVIVIKCQGDVVITSSATPAIDARNTGAAAGAGGTQSSPGGSTSGSDGTDGDVHGYVLTHKGLAGSGSSGGVGGAVGTVGLPSDLTTLSSLVSKYPKMFVGAGGAGGTGAWNTAGTGSVIGGTGGRGGGCLIIECAGALNFTTTGGISVSGTAAGNGSITGSPTNYNASGGGGGGGGSCFIYYNSLIANTGTITVAGGLGGNTKVGGGGSGNIAGSGGGGSLQNAGVTGGVETVDGNKSGGDGGAGYSQVAMNDQFA